MRRRTVLWTLTLAVIFGFGWYKSYENRADRERRAAWEARMQRLRVESQQEYERLVAWLHDLSTQPDARQAAMEELPGGNSLSFHEEDGRDVTSWTHPEYGIRLEMDFIGGQLVAHGAQGGTAHLQNVHPMPEQTATSSNAEHVREFVTSWGPWVWLVAVMFAIVPRTRYGLVAAEIMLGAALASGMAWTVSPYYSITVRGIFSNDRLFFAAIMLMWSLVMLAMRVAPFAAGIERHGSIRYGMRTLLAIMGIVAVFAAMGPLGLFAACVLVIGGVFFLLALRMFIDIRQAASVGMFRPSR